MYSVEEWRERQRGRLMLGGGSYEDVLHVLNTEGAAGFHCLVERGVHRRFDNDIFGSNLSLHHALIHARRLPWRLRHTLIEHLVNQGLDLNVVDGDGHTPLHRLLESRVRIHNVSEDNTDHPTAAAVRQLAALGARIVALPERAIARDERSMELWGFYVGPETLRALFEMGGDPFVFSVVVFPPDTETHLLDPQRAVVEEYKARRAVDVWASAAQPRLSPSAALSAVTVTGQGASLRVLAMLTRRAVDL